jgi:hypothetical protein
MKILNVIWTLGILFSGYYANAQIYTVVYEIGDLRATGSDYPNPNKGLVPVNPYKFPNTNIYKASPGSKFKLISENRQLIGDKNWVLVEFINCVNCPSTSGFVKSNTKYWMLDSVFDSGQVRLIGGFDFGLLTVPFKIRNNPSQISPNTSIGVYAGYKKSLNHNAYISGIFTFGLTGISLNDINASDVDNVMGITYAAGAIFHYKKLQIGLVGGADFIGGNRGLNWAYENKPWFSVATGFVFTK